MKKLKVYLLGGQSNMAGVGAVADLPAELNEPQENVIVFARGELDESYGGQYGWGPLQPRLGAFGTTFGPEITFGRDMAAANPGEIIALIKHSWGGTNLHYQWRPPSSDGEVGEMYKGFVKTVHDGLAALDPAFEPEIRGMIWMQGEADALDADMYGDYEKNLTNLIADLRVELGVPDMRFALAQIIDCATYAPPKWGAEVRQAQANVARMVHNTAVFDTSDYVLTDAWHYDAASMLSLGSRFAEAVLGLEKASEQARRR